MNAVVAEVPQEIVGLVGNAVQMAQALEISDAEIAELAGDDLKGLAKLNKQVEDTRFSITRPLDAAKKAAMDAYRPMLDRIEEADGIIRRKLNQYLAIEAEKRRQAEAAEQARLEAERAEIEARANAAIEAGDEEALIAAEDDALLAELHAPIAVPQKKIAGISTATTWGVESLDLHALVKAAAANPELLIYITPNNVEINKVVKALRERHNIPGVNAKAMTGLRVRS